MHATAYIFSERCRLTVYCLWFRSYFRVLCLHIIRLMIIPFLSRFPFLPSVFLFLANPTPPIQYSNTNWKPLITSLSLQYLPTPLKSFSRHFFFFIILLFYHCISPSLSLLDSFIRFIFFRVPLFFCSPVVMGTASEIVTCAKRPDWWFLFVSYF